MTNLFAYYLKLRGADKRKFRQEITTQAGCSDVTFYRYLSAEAPPLVKKLLSETSGIALDNLYREALKPQPQQP